MNFARSSSSSNVHIVKRILVAAAKTFNCGYNNGGINDSESATFVIASGLCLSFFIKRAGSCYGAYNVNLSMSAHKCMDRVVVEVGGRLHPILSVRETKKGTLILKPRRAKFHITDGNSLPTEDQKITIHVADDGQPNSIHHTLRSTDGTLVETHKMTCAIPNGHADILYGYTLPNLADRAPSQPIRPKDCLHKIATYLPSHSTLHVAILVAPPQVETSIVESSSIFEHILLPFRKFTLIVAASYSLLPSMGEGWLTHYITAAVSHNGERNGDFFPIAIGANPPDIKRFLESHLKISHYDAFLRAIEPLKEEVWEITHPVPTFLKKASDLGLRRSPYIPINQAGHAI